MTTTEAPRPRGKLKTLAFAGVLIFVSLLIGLALAELVVRIVRPQQLIQLRPDLWQPADSLGWLRRPDVNGAVNTGEGTVRLITDADGFRVGTAGRQSGTAVLLLGDSFMEALQVEYEESTAGLLERTLDGAFGAPVAVRNAGVSGWTPAQYLTQGRRMLARDDYRLVITAVYVGNDAMPRRMDYLPPRPVTERHRFRLPRAFSAGEFVDAFLRPVNDGLEGRSHLFVLLRNELKTLRMMTGTSPLYLPEEFLRREANAERWTITADICREIADAARAHGARAMFVLIPADFQVDREKFNEYVRGFGVDTSTVDLDQPTRRLHEEMTARGLVVVDALPRFRELDAGGADLYGAVDVHLSAAGHRAVVDLVTPVATRLLAETSGAGPSR